MRQTRIAGGLGVMFLAIAAACSSSSQTAPSLLGDSDSGPGNDPDSSAADGRLPSTDGEVADTYVPPPPVYVNSTHETTTYNNQTRLYDLSIPVDYDASKPYPLVLSFHGSPGTADLMLQYDPFDPASKKDAIVAYPNALGSDWDLTLSQTNDDFGFTKALIDLLAGKYNIDRSKVYGVGWSGGGFFVNMLACTMPGVMRAFAAHSGGAPYDMINPGGQHYGNGFVKCSDSEAPVAAIIFHGAMDPAVPYASGQFESTYWGFVNGCSDSTTATSPSPCIAHDNCPPATPVTFCGLPNDGHGVSANGFATSWAFFLALP